MKKIVLSLVVSLLFFSCEDLTTRKVTSEEILSEETRDFNWHEVDQYPAFAECRNISEVEAAKTCFGRKVSQYFYTHLEEKQPVVTEALNDTLFLYLKISEKGTPAIDSMEIDSLVLDQLPNIQEWLKESVDSLPTISPATKRGIPVKTIFRMPVVIQAE